MVGVFRRLADQASLKVSFISNIHLTKGWLVHIVTHHSVHRTDTYCKLAVSILYHGTGAVQSAVAAVALGGS